MDENQRTPQEYAYIMDGITERMKNAIEKIADSNRRVCIMTIMVVLIVVAGFLINNAMMINHVNSIRAAQAGEVVTHAEISQFGQGAGN